MDAIIKRPIITEKSSAKNDVGVYVFEVDKSANKIEVKKAIKSIYNADVKNVKIINVCSKSRLGKNRHSMVKRHGHKKAIITLKNKKTIDLNKFAKMKELKSDKKEIKKESNK